MDGEGLNPECESVGLEEVLGTGSESTNQGKVPSKLLEVLENDRRAVRG